MFYKKLDVYRFFYFYFSVNENISTCMFDFFIKKNHYKGLNVYLIIHL